MARACRGRHAQRRLAQCVGQWGRQGPQEREVWGWTWARRFFFAGGRARHSDARRCCVQVRPRRGVAARSHRRIIPTMPTGSYNAALLLPQPRGSVIVELHFFSQGYMDHGRDDWLRGLRYFSLLQTQNASRASRLDGVWFAGRMAIDLVAHSTFYYCTYIVPAPVMASTQPKIMHEVIHDYSISQNAAIIQHDGRYYAFGGEELRDHYEDGRVVLDDRDGIRVLEADTFEALQASWSHPSHATRTDSNIILHGDHPNCRTARHSNGVCEFDGMVSAVFLNGRWHVHVRANLKNHGGRFVQVARSLTSDLYGGFEPFQLISIHGYDPTPGTGANQFSNLYFLVADVHPLDPHVMIGLMPVNAGVWGVDNGNGVSNIYMSLSCDGVHWSAMTSLVGTTGITGRTYDQPVKGLLLRDRTVYWYLHRDVPNISPNSGETAILEYAFETTELMRVTNAAKATLAGCTFPPQSPPAAPPYMPPISPAPLVPPPSPPPSPPPASQLPARPHSPNQPPPAQPPAISPPAPIPVLAPRVLAPAPFSLPTTLTAPNSSYVARPPTSPAPLAGALDHQTSLSTTQEPLMSGQPQWYVWVFALGLVCICFGVRRTLRERCSSATRTHAGDKLELASAPNVAPEVAAAQTSPGKATSGTRKVVGTMGTMVGTIASSGALVSMTTSRRTAEAPKRLVEELELD